MNDKTTLTGYELSRQWFDFSFENPEKIKPIHTAIYFFAIEHNNRLGWRKRFGYPTTMVMEAIGVKSYNTYINALRDLVSFGFVEMIEQSKNQHSANIIALSKYNKALDKALDKAFIKHATKQSESTQQSDSSIVKPLTSKPIKQLTNIEILFKDFNINNSLKEKILEYIDYRKEIKKPFKSEKSIVALIKKLSTDSNAIAKINQTIENGWQGLFDLKEKPKSKNCNTKYNIRPNAHLDPKRLEL